MLSPSSAQLLAETIYAEEGDVHTAEQAASATKRVHEKLAGAMCPVLGEAGFRALLGRAAQKCRAAHPCLEGVGRLKGDDVLEKLGACLEMESLASIRATGAALLGEFLSLLSRLIGHELALRLLSPSWPAAIAQAIAAVEKS